MKLHIMVHSVVYFGLVFWDWAIQVNRKGTDNPKDFHTEVCGRSNKYQGAAEAVEDELNKHYRTREST
jgi:hypothetical protein